MREVCNEASNMDLLCFRRRHHAASATALCVVLEELLHPFSDTGL